MKGIEKENCGQVKFILPTSGVEVVLGVSDPSNMWRMDAPWEAMWEGNGGSEISAEKREELARRDYSKEDAAGRLAALSAMVGVPVAAIYSYVNEGEGQPSYLVFTDAPLAFLFLTRIEDFDFTKRLWWEQRFLEIPEGARRHWKVAAELIKMCATPITPDRKEDFLDLVVRDAYWSLPGEPARHKRMELLCDLLKIEQSAANHGRHMHFGAREEDPYGFHRVEVGQ